MSEFGKTVEILSDFGKIDQKWQGKKIGKMVDLNRWEGRR